MTARFRVVVAGGGVAGLEGLLALRAHGGDRLHLTLVTPGDGFRLRAFASGRPFGIHAADEVPYATIARDSDATLVPALVAEVRDERREVVTADGTVLPFDALLLAPGARTAPGLDHALTWYPEAGAEILGGLLRDVDEGYARRVAFVVPPGPAWPLPAYELAIMTAREARGMGIEAEISIVTAERDPLEQFGVGAAAAQRSVLETAGIRLLTGVTARVERSPRLHLAPEPPGDPLPVDRVVSMPTLLGPELAGVERDEHGFIRTDAHGLAAGCSRTWAAGDAVRSQLKMGSLAAYRARDAARRIAAVAGVDTAHDDDELVIDAVLMTGAAPVALDGRPLGGPSAGDRRSPARKVATRHLEAYLDPAPRRTTDA